MNLFLHRQENNELALGLPGLSEPFRGCCRSLTTVDDVTGGELPPRANCTLTLVTNSDFLGFLCVCACVCVCFLFVWGGGGLRINKTVPIYRTKPVLCECPQRYHF